MTVREKLALTLLGIWEGAEKPGPAQIDRIFDALEEPSDKMLHDGCARALETDVLLDDTRFACERAVWSTMLRTAREGE